ncbi:GTPase IMAP family member 9-like [Brachyhypopomus gauderio]|uniref:GTPase IMAP family member 9-like n=1 Tax=Brachyhypopomus gauderio TaxID=698409 RepID=UPI00404322A1
MNRSPACAGSQSASLLSLVLVGRRNAGKTSVANTILGKRDVQAGEKTTECVKKHGWVDGVRLVVVDTPGWSVFGLASTRRVRRELQRSTLLCWCGHRAFLLVIPTDDFSNRDQQAVEEYMSVLGHDVWKRTMVLFTWADVLRGRSIEEHIQKSGDALHKVLDKCGYRYHVFSNKRPNYSQVSELVQLVKQMCS